MGSSSQQPAARLMDIGSDHEGYPPTPVIFGSLDVTCNGRPVARQGDMLIPHLRPKSPPHMRAIKEGSASVLVNGKPWARVSDAIDCGGTIITGSGDVMVGDSPKLPAAISKPEWAEVMAKTMALGPVSPYQERKLQADAAVKYRGPAAAVEAWQEYYAAEAQAGNAAPAEDSVSDPLERQGLQAAQGAPALPASKAASWMCRQGQISQAKDKSATMPPGAERDRLTAATERFERDNVAVEKARLAADVYAPDKGPPEGWTNLSNDPEQLSKYGLKPDDLQKPGSNFRAQVYAPDPAVFGDDMKPVVAFKGTDFSSMEDWSNNLNQGINREAPYYRSAVEIGGKVQDSGADVEFAGHSLGGGLASAASRASGLPASTFNSAGLHEETVARYGGNPTTPDPENITAYRVGGEILTGVQEQGLLGTVVPMAAGFLIGGVPGALIGAAAKVGLSALMRDGLGNKFDVPGTGISPVGRHGMNQVVAGIETQMKGDQAILASATGAYCD